jgi:hypothetical protein
MQMESEFYDIDEESAKRVLRRKLIPLNLCKIRRPREGKDSSAALYAQPERLLYKIYI